MRIKQTKKREKIEELHGQGDFDEIGKLEGFTIFEIRDWEEDTRNRFGCVTWIFSGDKAKVSEFTRRPSHPLGYEETDDPKKGDLVTYFFIGTKRFEPSFQATHIGIYIGDGRVRSKFRESHVYEHPLGDVLFGYGTEVRFFHKQ